MFTSLTPSSRSIHPQTAISGIKLLVVRVVYLKWIIFNPRVLLLLASPRHLTWLLLQLLRLHLCLLLLVITPSNLIARLLPNPTLILTICSLKLKTTLLALKICLGRSWLRNYTHSNILPPHLHRQRLFCPQCPKTRLLSISIVRQIPPCRLFVHVIHQMVLIPKPIFLEKNFIGTPDVTVFEIISISCLQARMDNLLKVGNFQHLLEVIPPFPKPLAGLPSTVPSISIWTLFTWILLLEIAWLWVGPDMP